MLIEMSEPFQTYLVIGPPIRTCCNGPVVWKAALRVPTYKVVLALKDQKWWHVKPIATNACNRCRPFSIPGLYGLALSTSIGACYNHVATNHSHYKARLVEVVDVAVRDPVLLSYIVK